MKKTLFSFFFILPLFFLNKEANHILIIGDSLSCYNGGWQDQVAKHKSAQITNISKGGKRCDWLLSTLQTHLKTKNNYSECFIYGGCNDAYSYVNLDSSISKIQKMVNLCNSLKIKPIVIVGYDPDRVMTRTNYDAKTTKFHRARYVQLQEKMVTNLKNCKIINKDTTVNNSDTDDGVHLKASGHKKFGKWIINHL